MTVKSPDEFGDRMKMYEKIETSRRLDPSLPIYARIDGRGFSKFTKGMNRPYDLDMTNAMIATTKALIEATHATFGYTQSDEISLIWMADEGKDIFFSGKVQKMASVLAGLATSHFIMDGGTYIDAKYFDRYPHFDARVFQLPSVEEGANAFLWREMDAQKNSISMAASAHYSSKELHKKSGLNMIEMLLNKGVNYSAYPAFFKRGTFLRRSTYLQTLSEAELENIPEAHRPTGPVMRSRVTEIDMPPFVTVKNRVDVVFNGATPIV